MKTTIHVVFEHITRESSEQGDYADHGFIHPETERQHSMRTKRGTERTLRLSKRGRLDWTSLRAAIEWCESQAGDREPPEGQADDRLQVRYFGDMQDDGSQTNVTLFVEHASSGTLERLTECLANRKQGRSVYFG